MHARTVTCAFNELSSFDPPSGRTCGAYLETFLAAAPGGQLLNPFASAGCEYCPLSTSDQFLAGVAISWTHRWRDYGIGFAYIGFNIVFAVIFYYLFRVKKWSAASMKSGPSKVVHGVKTGLRGLRACLVGHGKDIPKPGQKEEVWTNRNRVF